MVEQQARSPGLATLAALSLASQLAIYGLVDFNSCSGGCGFGLLPGLYFSFGIGFLLGGAAWLGATVRAARRHDGLSALCIGLLPLVALSNSLLVNRHIVSDEQASSDLVRIGVWGLFHMATVMLLVLSLTRRQALQRVVAVAGLVLAVAVLIASNLVDWYGVM